MHLSQIILDFEFRQHYIPHLQRFIILLQYSWLAFTPTWIWTPDFGAHERTASLRESFLNWIGDSEFSHQPAAIAAY
jgi:hypothetical protein